MIILYLIIFYLLNSLGQYLTYKNGKCFYEERIQNNKTTPKVFDIGFKYLPDYTDDQCLLFILNSIIVIAPFFVHFILGHKILNEYFYYFIIIYLIRLVMINSTILPKMKRCVNEFNLFSTVNGHCYDKIFSGHFSSIFLLVLILYSKKIYTNVPVLTSFIMFIALLILLTRSHYTIDIIVAVFVVSFVYCNVPIVERFTLTN